MIRLIDAIEDLDDVQNVYTNADISDEVLEQLDDGVIAPGSRLPARLPQGRAAQERLAGVA